jgi:hypothetical protein
VVGDRAQRPVGDDGGEVDDRAGGRGGRDAAMDRDVDAAQRGAVHREVRRSAVAVPHRDVKGGIDGHRGHAPEPCRRRVAQHRLSAAREHRREPVRFVAQGEVRERIHAAIQAP